MERRLKDITEDLTVIHWQGPREVSIGRIVFDSREAGKDCLFVAVKGTKTDGHKFIDKAIEAGAAAVICQTLPEAVPAETAVVQVHDSALALGWTAAAFHDYPSQKLHLVGVTGTNGKTTTVTLLYQLFQQLGFRTGLLSTVENRVGDEVVPAAYTTPDAVALQGLLAKMVKAGCEYAFMEVSSHAVVQQRISGLEFRGGIFTNMSHEHLDYHGSFQAYIQAKKRFFDGLTARAFALINKDDKRGPVMVQNTAAAVSFYSLHQMAEFRARIVENSLNGLQLRLDGNEFYSPLIGAYNAYNLLAAYGCGRLLGIDATGLLKALSLIDGVEGRFEKVFVPGRGTMGIIDYAHTPDALEKVLDAIQELRKKRSRVFTVIGCGGDRDREKRPLMARIASRLSDQVIFTSDNPRSEDPEAILDQMSAGLTEATLQKVLRISNRREAIKTAAALAGNHDIILVAGKGHEKYQEIKGKRFPFDDKKELINALNTR